MPADITMAPLSIVQVKANPLASRTLFVQVGVPTIATWSLLNAKLSRGHQFYRKSTPSKCKPLGFGLIPRSGADGGDKLDETVGVSFQTSRVFF